MKRSTLAIVPVVALALAANATRATLIFNGTLTATDPKYNRLSSATSLSAVGTAVAYDTYTFTAGTGPYSIVGNYAAGGLDGYLFLYSTFAPATPIPGFLAADDDELLSGNSAALQGSALPSAGVYGSAVTSTVLTLTPGTTYTVVVTAFDNATVADGLGPYTLTITGNAAVPEPTSLGFAGVVGTALLRRRR